MVKLVESSPSGWRPPILHHSGSSGVTLACVVQVAFCFFFSLFYEYSESLRTDVLGTDVTLTCCIASGTGEEGDVTRNLQPAGDKTLSVRTLQR